MVRLPSNAVIATKVYPTKIKMIINPYYSTMKAYTNVKMKNMPTKMAKSVQISRRRRDR